MKNCYKGFVPMMAMLVVGFALLHSAPKVIAADDGTIIGSVKLSGTAPHMRTVDMSKDPDCVKANEGDPVKMENVVMGSGKGLENVVLYISEGLSGNEAVPSEEPTFDQKGCRYTPHILALDVNQNFKVTTSDQTVHHIHPMPGPGGGNIGWNKSQPPGAFPIVTRWKVEEAIPVKCNIHPWMHGWHVVVKGPYATTDSSGNYTIKNVPPGSYTVTAWQEEYGQQRQKVTVAAAKPATADFTFKAK